MDFIRIFKNVIYGMLIGGTQYLPISYTEKRGVLNFLLTGYDEEIIILIKGIGIIGASLALILLYKARFNPWKKGLNYFNIKLWKNIILGSCPSLLAVMLFKDKGTYLFPIDYVNYIVIVVVAFLFIRSERVYKKKRLKSSKIIRIERVTITNISIIGIIQGIIFSFGISPVVGGMIGCWIVGVSTYYGIEYSLLSSLCIYFIKVAVSFFTLNSLVLTFETIIACVLVLLVSFLVALLSMDILIALGKKRSLRVFAFINIFIGIIYLI